MGVALGAMFRPFPICVGMNRTKTSHCLMTSPVPHMRGDEPRQDVLDDGLKDRSPYAWG